jgi:3-oxoacyl-[acyl-carrier protein] reductase
MKVALITGGSRGIGRSMVEEFSAAGYAVAFTYLTSVEAAQALVAQISDRGSKAIGFRADVRDLPLAWQVVEETRSILGSLDVLINNARIRRDRELAHMDADFWSDVIDTNLNGAFHYTRACVGEMTRSGGVILNVTSADAGAAGQTNYAAARAGLIGFTRSLAKEVAPFGVRVNAIAPGYIDSETKDSLEEETRRKLYSQIPMGKAEHPCDVARLALYLAGEDASDITSQVFTIDRGLA